MTEYIVRTDKPIRLDEVLHLHGVHNFEVKRMDKHGRLIDADALIKRNRESKGILEDFKCDPTLVNVGYKSVIWEIKDLETAPAVLEASE